MLFCFVVISADDLFVHSYVFSVSYSLSQIFLTWPRQQTVSGRMNMEGSILNH